MKKSNEYISNKPASLSITCLDQIQVKQINYWYKIANDIETAINTDNIENCIDALNKSFVITPRI